MLLITACFFPCIGCTYLYSRNQPMNLVSCKVDTETMDFTDVYKYIILEYLWSIDLLTFGVLEKQVLLFYIQKNKIIA